MVIIRIILLNDFKMKKYFVKSTFGVAFILLVAGCATILKSPRQNISIVSQPANAKVVVYDSNNLMVWKGETPSLITLNKGNGYFKGASYRIEISKSGYQKMSLVLKPTVSGGWYIGGNLLVGGLIGWVVVDPTTGAMWLLNPQNLSVQLSKYDSNHIEGLKVVMIDEVDPKLLKDLQKIN
jgi:hypothetical protein